MVIFCRTGKADPQIRLELKSPPNSQNSLETDIYFKIDYKSDVVKTVALGQE